MLLPIIRPHPHPSVGMIDHHIIGYLHPINPNNHLYVFHLIHNKKISSLHPRLVSFLLTNSFSTLLFYHHLISLSMNVSKMCIIISMIFFLIFPMQETWGDRKNPQMLSNLSYHQAHVQTNLSSFTQVHIYPTTFPLSIILRRIFVLELNICCILTWCINSFLMEIIRI